MDDDDDNDDAIFMAASAGLTSRGDVAMTGVDCGVAAGVTKPRPCGSREDDDEGGVSMLLLRLSVKVGNVEVPARASL